MTDLRERNRLVEQYMSLAVSVATQLHRTAWARGRSLDEMVSDAYLYLIEAVDSWEPESGALPGWIGLRVEFRLKGHVHYLNRDRRQKPWSAGLERGLRYRDGGQKEVDFLDMLRSVLKDETTVKVARQWLVEGKTAREIGRALGVGKDWIKKRYRKVIVRELGEYYRRMAP